MPITFHRPRNCFIQRSTLVADGIAVASTLSQFVTACDETHLYDLSLFRPQQLTLFSYLFSRTAIGVITAPLPRLK
jgi:hypothetical protein